MKVTDEMVNRFLAWKLPADFSPDGGVSFKRESDYEHPEFGRTKFEPTGTNLLNAQQARAMLEHALATTQPQPERKPMTEQEIWDCDEIMSVNADAQISFSLIQRFVKAVERHRGIKEQP